VEVLGTKGLILTKPDGATDMRILKGAVETVAAYGWYPDRFRDAYRLEMQSFVASIVSDTETKVTAQDGKAAVEIAAAARKSMQEGKAVNLPL
jgi:scyllo-inositol 2-dehydrogenase (NAD+)